MRISFLLNNYLAIYALKQQNKLNVLTQLICVKCRAV